MIRRPHAHGLSKERAYHTWVDDTLYRTAASSPANLMRTGNVNFTLDSMHPPDVEPRAERVLADEKEYKLCSSRYVGDELNKGEEQELRLS